MSNHVFTETELDELKAVWFKSGYDAGHSDGYDEGYYDGSESGYNSGYDSGYSAGSWRDDD